MVRPKKNRNETKNIARGKPAIRDQRGMEKVPCLSRGPHDKSCICKGTGEVLVKK
jgi:hypothetical protein